MLNEAIADEHGELLRNFNFTLKLPFDHRIVGVLLHSMPNRDSTAIIEKMECGRHTGEYITYRIASHWDKNGARACYLGHYGLTYEQALLDAAGRTLT